MYLFYYLFPLFADISAESSDLLKCGLCYSTCPNFHPRNSLSLLSWGFSDSHSCVGALACYPHLSANLFPRSHFLAPFWERIYGINIFCKLTLLKVALFYFLTTCSCLYIEFKVQFTPPKNFESIPPFSLAPKSKVTLILDP